MKKAHHYFVITVSAQQILRFTCCGGLYLHYHQEYLTPTFLGDPYFFRESLNYFSAGIPAGSPYKLPCKIWSPQLKKWYQVPKHRGHYQSVIIISTDYTVQTFFCLLFKVWTMYIILESSFVPSAITLPFFDLQTPDFEWKFVWSARRDPCKNFQFQGLPKKNSQTWENQGNSHNSAIF